MATNTPTVIAGVSYPFRIEGGGLPAQATGIDVIRSALIVLLLTPIGSRVMRPTLGTNLYALVFEATGDLLRAMIVREITTTVAEWLPQVVVRDIQVVEQDKTVDVNVEYSIQGITDQTGILSIPR